MTEIEELIAAMKLVRTMKKIADQHELAITDIREEIIAIQAQLRSITATLQNSGGR